MSTKGSEDRFQCLDMLRVKWVNDSGKATSECAIVLEIWNSGALLQTETAIREGSILTVASPSGPVCAKVSTCTPDDYGFLIQMSVDSSECWFPNSYYPADLIPRSAA